MSQPVNVTEISQSEKERMAQAGIDFEMKNRCGTYIQMDQNMYTPNVRRKALKSSPTNGGWKNMTG